MTEFQDIFSKKKLVEKEKDKKRFELERQLIEEQNREYEEALLRDIEREELKKHEELLIKKAQSESEKLNNVRDMIMPLLKNLAKDPEKQYILWPDRAEKMKVFIKKVNTFVDGK
mgnify:CR=1 FL=1